MTAHLLQVGAALGIMLACKFFYSSCLSAAHTIFRSGHPGALFAHICRAAIIISVDDKGSRLT
jgi:hypothetical protein